MARLGLGGIALSSFITGFVFAVLVFLIIGLSVEFQAAVAWAALAFLVSFFVTLAVLWLWTDPVRLWPPPDR